MSLELGFWEDGHKRRWASQETCHRVVRLETGKSSQQAGRFHTSPLKRQLFKAWPPVWHIPQGQFCRF